MFIYLIKLISVCFINGLESRHISSTLRIDGRIVGGMNAKIDNFPYQLSLRYNGRHICGASIISQKYAITAAHCTDGTTPRSLSLRAGSTFFNQGGQIIQVYKIHQHPKFDIYTVDYDVAILETTNKININNKTTRTIKLTDEEAMEGNLAIVSGWGTLEENGPGLTIRLQMVQLPIVNRRQCESAYFKINRISSRMICAGFVEAGGKDSCQGDSGGPMVSNGRLSGIVSWGYGCGRQTYPGVYTNLGNKEIRQFVQNVANV